MAAVTLFDILFIDSRVVVFHSPPDTINIGFSSTAFVIVVIVVLPSPS